ncbi:MAG: LicD family protein [archaeon]|nr:LicD family protein [archaeon]
MTFKKIKNKLLNKDDQHDFYKKEYEKTNQKIKKIEKILDSYNEQFSVIFLNHTLTPTPRFEMIKELGYELLKFVDNICEKYGLEYWLDYGTLLGAIRHADYIPWDDDLDISMMRKDYEKFCEVINEEIENSNIKNLTATFKKAKSIDAYRWIQIKYIHPDHKASFVGLDIFAFDYLDNKEEKIEEKYLKSRDEFYEIFSKEDKYKEAIKKHYENLNLSLDNKEYFIPGAEGAHGPINRFKFSIEKTDIIFPLKRTVFGTGYFTIPNDWDYRLKSLYKNYRKMPKNIRNHNRIHNLDKIDNIDEKLRESLEILKYANENFNN